MSIPFDVVARMISDLDEVGCAYAVIGGLAVSARTEARFTRDLDCVVSVESDDDAEQLVHQFVQFGYDMHGVIEQEAAGRLAAVRLSPANIQGTAMLDLMFASSGIESELVAEAEATEFLPGITAPVATRSCLIALKVLSEDEDRLHDLADLQALLVGATPDEIDHARELLSLITQRGFNRERDLQQRLDSFIKRFIK